MTREEFMDIVYSELHSDGDNYRANRIIDAADEYAEDSSSENPNDWIPVSEKLPERWLLVNITIKDCNESFLTGVGYYRGSDDGTWFITAGDGEFLAENEVIAWQPLPEPFEGNTK